MSQKNVECAHRAYEAFNARDLDALLALMDPEVSFTTRFVERSEPYHGHGGVRAWWDDLLRVFPDFSVEVVEVRDVGDLTINAVHVRGHGLGSETPFEESVWQVGDWRAAKAISWHSYGSEAEALEAAGLSEPPMAQENVELVRSAFAAWNRGDLDAWVDHWDEQADLYPLRAQLEGSVYHGHEGLRRFAADMAEDWDRLRFEMDEIREVEDQIVGSGRFQARGRVSGIELDVPLGVIGVVRKGKLVYARFFSDPADAVAAAGLGE